MRNTFLFDGAAYLAETHPGLVVKSQSGFFTVELTDGRLISTQIPGRLKMERKDTSLVATGDRVSISINPDGTGVIQSVEERERVLSRARPSPDRRSLQADMEQVLVANPDQMISVFSIRKPEPSLRKLDRFLVVAEMNQLAAVVCVNKIDLVDPGQAQVVFSLYSDLGYQVIYTSALRGYGIDELRAILKDKISVMTGSSGVGKTSLLNALQPDLGRRVKEVSQATEKGLHTTRFIELVRLDVGGYLADTPGIRSLALFDLEPGELDGYFREIAPLVEDCQFSDCTHRHEPNCAVRAALSDGRVSTQRYDSYLRLREEHEMLEESEF